MATVQIPADPVRVQASRVVGNDELVFVEKNVVGRVGVGGDAEGDMTVRGESVLRRARGAFTLGFPDVLEVTLRVPMAIRSGGVAVRASGYDW
jgi:hypothetical protein